MSKFKPILLALASVGKRKASSAGKEVVVKETLHRSLSSVLSPATGFSPASGSSSLIGRSDVLPDDNPRDLLKNLGFSPAAAGFSPAAGSGSSLTGFGGFGYGSGSGGSSGSSLSGFGYGSGSGGSSLTGFGGFGSGSRSLQHAAGGSSLRTGFVPDDDFLKDFLKRIAVQVLSKLISDFLKDIGHVIWKENGYKIWKSIISAMDVGELDMDEIGVHPFLDFL